MSLIFPSLLTLILLRTQIYKDQANAAVRIVNFHILVLHANMYNVSASGTTESGT